MGNEVAKVAPKEAGSHRRTVIASRAATKDLSAGHTNRFMWYYPNWESYLDDAGNMYYYNDVLKETIWDPAEIYGGPPLPPTYEEGGDGQDITWDASDRAAPSLAALGKSSSTSKSMKNLTMDYQAKKVMQMEERKETLADDPLAHWKELAQVGHVDPEVIEEHVHESAGIAQLILVVISTCYDLFNV
jgi:hypothetical protein